MGADDCAAGYDCIRSGGASFCSRECTITHWGDGCSAGYACDTRGVCIPARDEQCRPEHARCGTQFEGCCAGMACREWEGWGSVCSRRCSADSDCWSGCCALVSDTQGFCAPPGYCE